MYAATHINETATSGGSFRVRQSKTIKQDWNFVDFPNMKRPFWLT